MSVEMMSIEAELNDLADKQVAALANLSWKDLAVSIRHAAPWPNGESDCVLLDGIWCEVSTNLAWESEQGGDIVLTIRAYINDSKFPNDRLNVERVRLVKKPHQPGQP